MVEHLTTQRNLDAILATFQGIGFQLGHRRGRAPVQAMHFVQAQSLVVRAQFLDALALIRPIEFRPVLDIRLVQIEMGGGDMAGQHIADAGFPGRERAASCGDLFHVQSHHPRAPQFHGSGSGEQRKHPQRVSPLPDHELNQGTAIRHRHQTPYFANPFRLGQEGDGIVEQRRGEALSAMGVLKITGGE